MTDPTVSNVYFGLSPLWVSTALLILTYAVIISEQINRSVVTLVGAAVMVVLGVITQEEAIRGIDWNTIGLLTGMMILVSISRRSGIFQYVAIWSAKAARAHPAGILLFRSPSPSPRSSKFRPIRSWSARFSPPTSAAPPP